VFPTSPRTSTTPLSYTVLHCPTLSYNFLVLLCGICSRVCVSCLCVRLVHSQTPSVNVHQGCAHVDWGIRTQDVDNKMCDSYCWTIMLDNSWENLMNYINVHKNPTVLNECHMLETGSRRHNKTKCQLFFFHCSPITGNVNMMSQLRILSSTFLIQTVFDLRLYWSWCKCFSVVLRNPHVQQKKMPTFFFPIVFQLLET